MSRHISIKDKVEVMDKYAQKMTNSGHGLDVIRRTISNGLKGHLRKVERCRLEKKPFHRSCALSAKDRRTKKLTQKQSWFKNKPKEDSDKTKEDRPDAGGQARGVKVDNKEVAKVNSQAPRQSKQQQPSTVLFVEFSRGGTLQASMRQVVTRLAPLVGFTMRVTERGGTPLSSLLSNKNVGAGQECGRAECRTCDQTGDKREDCVRRNILYESECGRCEKVNNDDVGLNMSGKNATLYVGETSRSLFERTSEHWQAADSMKEESHMVQHMQESHKGEGKPEFNFKVVKTFKTALDRQIAEAVRIEMRGNILNRKGEFNRCSLTRLGVDGQWEEERWRKSWEEQDVEEQENICLEESRKTRRRENNQGGNRLKRRKIEGGEVAWGEAMSQSEAEKQAFLNTKVVEPSITGAKQKSLAVLTGLEWQAYVMIKELAWKAVDMAWCGNEVEKWEAGDIPVPATTEEYASPAEHGGDNNVPSEDGESGPTQPIMGGQGRGGGEGKVKGETSQTITTGKRRKKKLPGPSATQKSVADFFRKQSKLEWVGQASKGPSGSCNISESVIENNKNTGPSVMCEMSVSVRSSSTNNNKNNSNMMTRQQGGEDTNSFEILIEGGRGEGEEIRKSSFLKENHRTQKLENAAHTESSDHSQSWRLKLMQFKSNNPDSGQL